MNVSNDQRRPGGRGAQLRLCVPPDPKAGGYVRQEIIAFAQQQGIDDDDVIDFVSAVGEALANAIEHAQTCEPIEISAWLLGTDRLFAAVRDKGIGFVQSDSALVAALPENFSERGRGLPIMRRCTDVFRLQSAPGQGTQVTLGCHVNRAASLQNATG
jgi:serine/threonine-protein kinase RsbW